MKGGAMAFVTLQAAAAMVRDAGRLLIAGSASEPSGLLDVVAADPDLWQGKILTGAFIPGVNNRDFTAVGQGTRVETIFATPGLEGDGVDHLPLHYSAFWARLARPGVVDAVVMTVPPPRADGTVGYGLTCDFVPAALAAGARLIGIVNSLMPDLPAAPRLPLSRFAALAEDASPLPEMPIATADAESRTIAGHVLSLLQPGDTLQLGLGKMQTAILQALAEARIPRLGYHAGMISDAIRADTFPRGITTGVALGTRAFYDRVADLPLTVAPVGQTHAPETLAALPAFVSVNSVIEIDLTGQANGEWLSGRQISGQGGMVDFVRGARASRGGRSILVLPSTAARGSKSRIVHRLPPGTPVSVTRADVDIVVTEHGIAHMREASLSERAQRLAAIAAPDYRTGLMKAAAHD
jgi:acyl-CoA hydrolase